jgi:hypothetical protein
MKKSAHVDKPQSLPRFSRIMDSVDLIAPQDCEASLILKLVAVDKYRRYTFHLLVGRYQQDAIKVRYEYTGADTLRCDIPTGTALAPAVLQPHLVAFLKAEGMLPDGPPIILGGGHDP